MFIAPRVAGRLNARFGTRCFLTVRLYSTTRGAVEVLMHLLALGAFCLRKVLTDAQHHLES